MHRQKFSQPCGTENFKQCRFSGSKLLTCFGPHIMKLIVASIYLGPTLKGKVTILLIFENILFVG
jgi:hypothetical protein